MSDKNLCAVTGVSGYSGRHITRRLLAKGKRVINLTGHPDRPHEFGDQIFLGVEEAFPLSARCL